MGSYVEKISLFTFLACRKLDMPHGEIRWIGPMPDHFDIFEVAKKMIRPVIDREAGEFPVLANYWPTNLQSEKCLLYANTAFFC